MLKVIGGVKMNRVISYACSYVPVEIIIAAGLFPRRIIPESRPSDADAYIHPNTCCYVKSLLATALEGEALQTDGIIFANSCDGMRKLYDIWKEYVKDVTALFIDIPKKKDQDSIEFFASELRRFARDLERELEGSNVTEESLNVAIKACNEVRFLMGEVFKLQRDAKLHIRGAEVFRLCLEGVNSDATEFASKLRQFISSLREERPSHKGRRIVLTGNIINRPDLISLIEDSGGRVVALDTCICDRHYDKPVEEDSPDPISALAKRYLLKAPCARMEGIEERFQYLKGFVDDSMADGIIYSAVKFCDTFVYDVPLMRNRFEQAEVPFLFLDNDYEWTNLGQMRTRVEAFVEMIR